MAKSLTLVDILTNAFKVFKKDLYIVNNSYIIAGPVTSCFDTGLEGNYLITLEPEVKEFLNDELHDTSVYYLKKVKKEELVSSLEEVLSMKKAQEVRDKVQHIYSICTQVTEFKQPYISNEAIHSLYENGSIETLVDENGKQMVMIAKDLFPLITATTFKNVQIGYVKLTDLWRASFKYTYTGFRIMAFVHFYDI